MKIALIGPGAVGGYYAAMLINAGYDVNLIVKPKYYPEFTGNGIKVKSFKGDFSVRTPHVIPNTNVSSLEKVDLLFVTTKCFDTEQAIKQCMPIVGENTIVVSIQNGVDNVEKISKHIGKQKTICGLAYIAVAKKQIGHINHAGNGQVILGELDSKITDRTKQLQEMFTKAGVQCDVSDEIMKKAWTKLSFNCSYNSITAITKQPIAKLASIPETKEILKGIMKEVISVANALKIGVDETVIDDTLARFNRIGGFKSSMQQDIEAGNKIELDGIPGIVVKKGKQVNIPTPLNQLMYSLLKAITMDVK